MNERASFRKQGFVDTLAARGAKTLLSQKGDELIPFGKKQMRFRNSTEVKHIFPKPCDSKTSAIEHHGPVLFTGAGIGTCGEGGEVMFYELCQIRETF